MRSRRVPTLLVVLLAALAVGVVVVLRQSAMFDDDQGPSHAATRVVVHVRYQDGHPASDADTRLLWSKCSSIPGERKATSIVRGTMTATLVPALGDDVLRRLVGCLDDFIVPGMLGQVISTQAVPLGPHPDAAGPPNTRSPAIAESS